MLKTTHILHLELLETVLVLKRWYIPCDVTLYPTNPLFFDEFENLQRTSLEIILGTVISDNPKKQACLPITKTGVGIKQADGKLNAAYAGLVPQSDVLVEQLTGEKTRDHQIFQKK